MPETLDGIELEGDAPEPVDSAVKGADVIKWMSLSGSPLADPNECIAEHESNKDR